MKHVIHDLIILAIGIYFGVFGYLIYAKYHYPKPTWAIVEGSLPPGLTLSVDGTISGVIDKHAKVGIYTVKLEVLQ